MQCIALFTFVLCYSLGAESIQFTKYGEAAELKAATNGQLLTLRQKQEAFMNSQHPVWPTEALGAGLQIMFLSRCSGCDDEHHVPAAAHLINDTIRNMRNNDLSNAIKFKRNQVI